VSESNVLDLPVLIIGYSRVDSINKSVHKLISMGVSQIFIAIDFASNLTVQNEQRELVKNLNLYGNDRIKVWYRNRNHGVAVGIISALDWFFTYNEKGVVLEDDLVFNYSFLEFCSSAFKNYSKENLFMISGNRFNQSEQQEFLAVTNYPQIWGWATWRENWIEMRSLIIRSKKLKIWDLISPSKCFFYSGAKRAQSGLIDTWDIPLAYEMLKHKKICLLPPVNLVSNVGVDSHSSHTRNGRFPLNHPITISRDFEFPEINKLRATTREANKFLEKRVFRVKLHHIASPIKLWIEGTFRLNLKTSLLPLNQRLMEGESAPKI